MKTVSLFAQLNPDNLEIRSLMGDYGRDSGMFKETPLAEAKLIDPGFDVFCPEILKCIDSIIARKEYPYNSTVEAEVLASHGKQGGNLGRLVYNSQKYRHLRDSIIEGVDKSKELTQKGFQPLHSPKTHIGKKFRLVASTTNLIGAQGLTETKPHTLISDADNNLFFVLRSNSRKGIHARHGMYVKTI